MLNNGIIDFNTTIKIQDDYIQVYQAPTIGYMFNVQRRTIVKNILKNFVLKDYVVQGSDRPEFVAYKLYGDVEYIWILLIINDILDPYYDWICPSQTIYEYADQKYINLGGLHSTHHFVSPNKDQFYNVVQKPGTQEWYDHLDTNYKYLQYKGFLEKVSNIEYELAVNESKRNIRVLNPTELSTFMFRLAQGIKEANV